MNTEQPEGSRSDALEWILMHDGTPAAAAAEFEITAQTSDEELEGMAWMAVRAAYDEGYSLNDDDMLPSLKVIRQAVP